MSQPDPNAAGSSSPRAPVRQPQADLSGEYEVLDIIPDGLVDDLHSAMGEAMNYDGSSDETNDWMGDIISALLPHIARELASTASENERLRGAIKRHRDAVACCESCAMGQVADALARRKATADGRLWAAGDLP